MMLRTLGCTIAALLAPQLVSMAFGQLITPAPPCASPTNSATYRSPPLTYPMTSNRYAVQYKVDGGNWISAQVYISYYGGSNSSPYLNFSPYSTETSMSYASIPAQANAGVQLRVTKLWDAPFVANDHVSVRPGSKRIPAELMPDGTVQISTRTTGDFSGEQFILWWQRGTEGGGVEGLAFFLNPPYGAPTGSNVKTIVKPADLTGDLSQFDTLAFQGTVAIGGTGAQEFSVPMNINTIFLAPGAWVQGKLSFLQSGLGNLRRVYGPGVLDVSRFEYDLRHCTSASGYGSQGDSAIAETGPTSGLANPNLPDRFELDGFVIADHNHAATDRLVNSTVNNVKTISWNGENGGMRFGELVRVSNVFIRAGDDSLMVWGGFDTVTNATVWQSYNGGVINLGWLDNSPGDNCLIDGVYVVKTDWNTPTAPDWTSNTAQGVLNHQNNGVVVSMMVPGTRFGSLAPAVFRDIVVDDPPQVLLSLKILPPDCNDSPAFDSCPVIDLTLPSVLNLNLERVFAPASAVENSIGFQSAAGLPTMTGRMNIEMNDVEVARPSGQSTILTSGNAASVGNLSTNGANVNITYGDGPQAGSGPPWYTAWTAGQGGGAIDGAMSGASVRMIVRPTISGTAVRVKLENTLGNSPVSFSAAYIGLVQSGAAVVPGSNTPLTFGGLPGITLGPGDGAYSDPLPFPVTAFSRYAVSLDVISAPSISGHPMGLVTNYMATGAHAADAGSTAFTPVPNNSSGVRGPTFPVYWVAAVDVASASNTGTVVALGDSITDGQCSTRTNGGASNGTVLPDLYAGWTDLLAARFAALPAGQTKAVANEGIAGDQVSGGNQPALIRVISDVLEREGATHVIFLQGSDDLAAGTTSTSLIAADQQIIDDAHEMGLKIIGATLIPRGADSAWTGAMESQRFAVNNWIRNTANFDGVIDFDALMEGPVNSATGAVTIASKWLCYDGVRPNSAGYAAMAGFIDLSLFLAQTNLRTGERRTVR